MAWDDDMVVIVRSLLQDETVPSVYQDDGLLRVLLISAMQVKVKHKFAYAVSIANETLSPDPTGAATKDDAFTLLTCYTAVVALLRTEIRLLTRQGIDVQDGDSKISLRRDSAALDLMLKSYEKQLEDMTYEYQTDGGDGFGEAIVTPYPYITYGNGPFGGGHAFHDRIGGSWS